MTSNYLLDKDFLKALDLQKDKTTYAKITLLTFNEEPIYEAQGVITQGSVNVDGARIKCWKAGGHGSQTFLEVVQNSCNLLVNTGTHLSLLRTL